MGCRVFISYRSNQAEPALERLREALAKGMGCVFLVGSGISQGKTALAAQRLFPQFDCVHQDMLSILRLILRHPSEMSGWPELGCIRKILSASFAQFGLACKHVEGRGELLPRAQSRLGLLALSGELLAVVKRFVARSVFPFGLDVRFRGKRLADQPTPSWSARTRQGAQHAAAWKLRALSMREMRADEGGLNRDEARDHIAQVLLMAA